LHLFGPVLLAEVYLARDLPAMTGKDAHHMAALAVICALATATSVGYYVGRQAGSSRPSWKKRTGRIALGRLVISLLVLMTARRVRQRFAAERLLRNAVDMSGLRTVVPLDLLRDGVARRRSY
jgi:hypothetical protein